MTKSRLLTGLAGGAWGLAISTTSMPLLNQLFWAIIGSVFIGLVGGILSVLSEKEDQEASPQGPSKQG